MNEFLVIPKFPFFVIHLLLTVAVLLSIEHDKYLENFYFSLEIFEI